jgi:hypothetical protein
MAWRVIKKYEVESGFEHVCAQWREHTDVRFSHVASVVSLSPYSKYVRTQLALL